MPFVVYILRSKSSGRFYIGHTENLPKRIAEHNNNRTPSIKNRGPWELVHLERFASRVEAAKREQYIKRMKSHEWIQQLVRASR